MTKFHSILSDVDLEKEFATGLKKRVVDQKFQYLDEGANVYYKSFETKQQKNHDLYQHWAFMDESLTQYSNINTEKDNYQLNSDNIFCLEKIREYLTLWLPTALISIGCGNWSWEKKLLQQLLKEWYKFEYYGVDSSRSMLELADENLQDVDMKKVFIHADITTEEFREEIKKMTAHIDIRIYAFIGWTFCNRNQPQITTNIYNMMESNDILRIDMLVREVDNQKDNELVYSRYLNFLQDERLVDEFFFPLRNIWITIPMWKVGMVTSTEEQVWAIVFKFYFEFTKEVNIKYRNESIFFIPWDRISLLEVRKHHIDTFLSFMSKLSFTLASKSLRKVNFLSRAHLFFIKKELLSE